MKAKFDQVLVLFWVSSLLLAACQPAADTASLAAPQAAVAQAAAPKAAAQADPPPLHFFTPRPLYDPGELVDYTARAGDTLPALAVRFNTSVGEILKANPFIPPTATTMPQGMPMKIPIYYLPLWGPSYLVLPDSLFINGPAQVGFDTGAFANRYPGWLKAYSNYVAGATRTGPQIIDLVARNFSVSPRLLLALLEYQARALSSPEIDPELKDYPLGKQSWEHKDLYPQLIWAANALNNGYYGYLTNHLTAITYDDGRLERLDPWLNAATASLHNYFNSLYAYDDYLLAVSPDGFAQTYRDLFGDPWQADQPHIPGNLAQPEFVLPFEPGSVWAYTGGPHTGWGSGEPFAALDFAPPSEAAGCLNSEEWATAIAPGKVVRVDEGVVVLDLDGDNDERTGWSIFYLHIETEGRVPLGVELQRGDPVGHPSCEGGTATGTHIHIARKYNGEWVPAEGVLAFNLEGWVAHNGAQPYLGTLTKFAQVVTACTCSNAASFIQTERK